MPSFFRHIRSSFSILLFALIFPSVATATGDTAFQVVALELEQEMVSVEARYQLKWDQLQRAIRTNKVAMLELSKGQLAAEEAVVVLAEKIRLGEEKQALSEAFAIDIAHIRYRKGIEVIKILYEKVLGLDHHFTSLKTHQSIQRLSNPNAYPDFQNSGELLKERLYKKSSVTMPSFLQSNNYVSAVYSLVSGFFGDGKSSERQSELDDVSCILDFTLKMGNDLNTIYYETKFLINNNNDLRNDCIQLFDDFVDVIDYTTSLEKCREEDDWEAVDEALEKFIEGLKSAQDSGDERLIRTVVNKGHIDMEFAIDRLLGYLDKYAAFINQGENYYKKFAVVVDSYDNEAACASKLPIQFSSLKDEIRFSIEKFIQAYDIAELKGSKLKDLLYGYE